MGDLLPSEYADLLGTIRQRVRDAQYAALRAVNQELISLYWDIGRMIVERQQGESWGRSVVVQLSKDLQAEFPGLSGFSTPNLWKMKQFYEEYANDEKLSPLVREIGWTHNCIILMQCKDPLEREFYIRMTRKFGWSKNVLIHQIEMKTYEKTLGNQTNFDRTLPEEVRNRAKLAVKDEYTFDFLDLGDEFTERQLEAGLIARVEAFLREMGGVFTFVGSQYRLTVGDKEFFIDILLYHRTLRALVAVELKIGEFEPEHVGKMQFYLAVLNDTVRLPDENPSIGIILCRGRDRTIVEYALREATTPIGVGSYRLTPTLPSNLAGQLPSPEQIAKLLEEVEP